jgi:hypothetical protein
VTFVIELLPEPIIDPETGYEAVYGEITLNAFEERFVALTTFWAPTDYEHHWRSAIERIVDGAERSCLITSLHDPRHSHILFWWPLYRVANQVFVQHAILFLDQLVTPFDPANPFTHVPNRRTRNEDGEQISEWQVTVRDLVRFRDRSWS